MKSYTILLRLLSTTVDAETREEALRLGKLKLAQEWPRLWDVIMGKDDEEFEVRIS